MLSNIGRTFCWISSLQKHNVLGKSRLCYGNSNVFDALKNGPIKLMKTNFMQRKKCLIESQWVWHQERSWAMFPSLILISGSNCPKFPMHNVVKMKSYLEFRKNNFETKQWILSPSRILILEFLIYSDQWNQMTLEFIWNSFWIIELQKLF